MESEDHLRALVERLGSTDVLTQQEAKNLHKRALESAMPQMLRGQTYGEAMGGLAILNQNEQAFRSELKGVDNNLARQIEIVHEALDGWFTKGVSPAPYYAWRIAIILSKSKRKNEEGLFLAAWCRHFGAWKGGRYEALAERAKKMGVT